MASIVIFITEINES